ncbi:hypothetical protein [Empedobacter brevis]|uniref:hypothetical protein n=1 Tax=Empedobacter brevis TaxID=247 RepID=UPI0028D2867B|nr:hypothetical protein [Empedobacter brevis]
MKTTFLTPIKTDFPEINGNVHSSKPSKQLTSVMINCQTLATFSDINGLSNEDAALIFVEALKIQQCLDLNKVKQIIDFVYFVNNCAQYPTEDLKKQAVILQDLITLSENLIYLIARK